jgi:predicted DNA-binding transcriptional regulator AlpA
MGKKETNQFIINGRRMLGVNDVASYLGLSPRTIYNMISGKNRETCPIPKPKKIGSRLLWDVVELDKFIDKLQAA